MSLAAFHTLLSFLPKPNTLRCDSNCCSPANQALSNAQPLCRPSYRRSLSSKILPWLATTYAFLQVHVASCSFLFSPKNPCVSQFPTSRTGPSPKPITTSHITPAARRHPVHCYCLSVTNRAEGLRPRLSTAATMKSITSRQEEEGCRTGEGWKIGRFRGPSGDGWRHHRRALSPLLTLSHVEKVV